MDRGSGVPGRRVVDRRMMDRRTDERRGEQRLGQDRRERVCRSDDVKIAAMTEEMRHTAWLQAMVEHEISGVRWRRNLWGPLGP